MKISDYTAVELLDSAVDLKRRYDWITGDAFLMINQRFSIRHVLPFGLIDIFLLPGEIFLHDHFFETNKITSVVICPLCMIINTLSHERIVRSIPSLLLLAFSS